MEVPCDMLLHPELLTNEQLIYIIKERHLRIPNIENMAREQLLDLFHHYCIPYGQRKYRDSGRGKILNRSRHLSPEPRLKLNTMTSNDRKSSHPSNNRIKPPPDLLSGHMKRIKLENKPLPMFKENNCKRKMSVDSKKLLRRCAATFFSEGAMATGSEAAPEAATNQTSVPTKRAGASDAESTNVKRPNLNETFKEAKTGVRMAIITADYPTTNVVEKDVGPIVRALFARLAIQSDPLPKFSIGSIISGALHVFCDGEQSAEWLRSFNGQTIGEVKVKVARAKDLSKPVKMAWKSKNVWVTETAVVLSILQRLNPELCTKDWKVIDTEVGGGHVRRIVLMDKVSAEFIKSKSYCLYAGVDRAFFKLLDDGEGRGEARCQPIGMEVEGEVEGEAKLDAPATDTEDAADTDAHSTVGADCMLSSATSDILGEIDGLNLTSPPRREEEMDFGP